jgi:hypothetical protein
VAGGQVCLGVNGVLHWVAGVKEQLATSTSENVSM